MNLEITAQFLDTHPEAIFVFGDNLERRGTGGAAKLRDYNGQTYGFITKKTPKHDLSAYYTVEEYRDVFEVELSRLRNRILSSPDRIFYVSKLGAGLANKFGIYEAVIQPRLAKELEGMSNVVVLSW